MKKFKLLTLSLLVVVAGLFITSCDETTTPTENPVITSVTPNSGVVGDNITIKGSGFGDASASGSVVVGDTYVKGTVGAANSDYIKWTDTEIIFKVPADAKITTTTVHVEVGTGATAKISNKMPFTIGGPSSTIAAPKSPLATAIADAANLDNVGIRVAWQASQDESLTNFYGYRLEITDASTSTTNIAVVTGKTTKVYDFKNLTAGKVYDIKIRTMLSTGAYSSNAAVISWAPAKRFTNITIYESESTSPSGLQLYDAATGKPLPLTIANGSKWDIALDTKGNDWAIGSPSKLSYSKITNPRKTTLYMPDEQKNGTWVNGSTLDTSFDTDLNGAKTVEQQIGFDDTMKDFVFAVRTADGNFAKILVKKVNGKFLQGTAPNRYVTLDVSYQLTKDIPYAK